MSFTLLPTIAWCGSALFCPQQPTSVPVDVLMHHAPGYEFSGGGGPANVIRYVDPLNEAHQMFTVPAPPIPQWIDYDFPPREQGGVVPPVVVPPPVTPPPPCCAPPPPPCCVVPPPPPPPVVTATPEPGTWGLVAFGILAAAFGLRRARSK